MEIRNFCILAHIDHGKSTLADRFLELTGTIEKRKMHEQFLDMHPLEREKGITIKMQPVRMEYELNGEHYILDLIDTPGHVDFSYEVSRALAAVEGAILLVDATQGVQAQTLANLHLAQQEGLVIIPAINKIDLPSADVARAKEELAVLLDISGDSICAISAKTGEGVSELLRVIIEKIPSPEKARDVSIYQNVDISEVPLRALVFDSFFDSYQGVIAEIRVMDGIIKRGDRIRFLATGAECEVMEAGVFLPQRMAGNMLSAGEIGYVATGFKETEKVRVGDTVTRTKDAQNPKYNIDLLPGYKEPEPMVFSSLFPENQEDYEVLRESLKKLKLNDASLLFEPEEAGMLGRGFRVGFLGVLHMEITSERLRREYDLALVFSNPSVAFRVTRKNGAVDIIFAATKIPDAQDIVLIEEPWVRVEIITPLSYYGTINTLVHEHEGRVLESIAVSGERLRVVCEAPLRGVIIEFYDQLKSITQGFASMSYSAIGYRPADVVRLDILVAGERVPVLSEVVPREKAYLIARARLEKLKEYLPKKLFVIPLQAEIQGRIIARETISALKKDVTGYLYGGDRTRKMKLWKKQQEGKKRLKEGGRVVIEPDVFLKILRNQ